MERKPVTVDAEDFPEQFRHLINGSAVFDSSCSELARVYCLERFGLFLKSAPKGGLAREAAMSRYFHSRKLGPEVLAYESLDRDWLLTARIPGEDGTHADFRGNPERLCDTVAECLRQLHETDPAGCPVERTAEYLATARQNRAAGLWSPIGPQICTREEAGVILEQAANGLASDTLIHGDCCLPNILLDNWRFTGFIDLGAAGLGDRHMDLFWCLWSLGYNLKTDRYTDRFLDAYGRDRVSMDLLRVVAAVEGFG